MDFVVPANHWEKLKENEKWDKYLDLTKELKKDNNTQTMEREGDDDSNSNQCTWNNLQSSDEESRKIRNHRTS